MRDAFKAMPVKSDRKDARGIAQLMRLGWFRPLGKYDSTRVETADRIVSAPTKPAELTRKEA